VQRVLHPNTLNYHRGIRTLPGVASPPLTTAYSALKFIRVNV